jgi:capsular polysaccharide biosynthesis protein
LLNVGIVEHAALPVQTIPGGQRQMSIMLAAITGLVLGVGGSLGIELFRTSVTSERELERQLELPVLAAIERFPSK